MYQKLQINDMTLKKYFQNEGLQLLQDVYFYAKASWLHWLPRPPGTMGSAQLLIKETSPGTSALVSSPTLCQVAFFI